MEQKIKSSVLGVLIALLVFSNAFAQETSIEALQKGVKLGKAGKYDEAIAEFTKAIGLNSNNAKAYYDRGLTYKYKGDLDHAIADYTKVLELNPKNIHAYVNRGIAYKYKGKLDQAIADYNKAIELNPNFILAYKNRVIVFYKQKEYAKSWDDVHKLEKLGVKIDPKAIEKLKKASGKDE